MSRTCSKCGRGTAIARELHEYHYVESGLRNVYLSGGVFETKCSTCNASTIRVWNEPQLLQLIARDLLMSPSPRTGPEFRFIRRASGLTQSGLAGLLSCRRATIADRESKHDPKIPFAEELGVRAVLLRALQKHLATPGNNALAPSQFEKLWKFSGFLDHLAKGVAARHKIQAAIQQELWTSNLEQPAA
jgi:hypothetical protein